MSAPRLSSLRTALRRRDIRQRAHDLNAAASLSYFTRGYRYARGIAPAEEALPTAVPGHVNPLEDYFNALTEGPGIHKWSHYFDIYHRHLDRFRGRPVHIVEIGVFGGGCLQMWREYFGPDTHIYGVDIDPGCRALESENVEIVVGDQSDPQFWGSFLERCPRIDVVIDDGGHEAHQQAVTLECLLPHIRPGGVYVCEDIHGAFHYFHSFVDGLTRPLNSIKGPEHRNPALALHEHVASVHRYPILTVIEKPVACPREFTAPRHGTEWPAWARRPARGAQS
ncbi:MAG: class I SAM-dependent methyltransferase [Solirubrobacteraceae bacterium]